MKDLFYKLKGTEPVEVESLIDAITEGEIGKQVAYTKLNTGFGKIEVSTIFLTINHALMGGRPVLFETMVFGGKMDRDCERYHTWQQAEQGHEVMVQRVILVEGPYRQRLWSWLRGLLNFRG